MHPRFILSDVAIVSRFFTALGEGNRDAARAVVAGDLSSFPHIVDGEMAVDAIEGLGDGLVIACGTLRGDGAPADAYVLVSVSHGCITGLEIHASKDEALAAVGIGRVA